MQLAWCLYMSILLINWMTPRHTILIKKWNWGGKRYIHGDLNSLITFMGFWLIYGSFLQNFYRYAEKQNCHSHVKNSFPLKKHLLYKYDLISLCRALFHLHFKFTKHFCWRHNGFRQQMFFVLIFCFFCLFYYFFFDVMCRNNKQNHLGRNPNFKY